MQRRSRGITIVAATLFAAMALISPDGSEACGAAPLRLESVLFAAALGAFVPIASSFAKDVGNGTFEQRFIRDYAIGVLVALFLAA
ncbi:MAG TPA: hypothetical protein VGD01_11945, partial [Candidatus Elarobacter sp.]